MVNFMAFVSSFASYLFVFLVFVVVIVLAVVIGVTAAKIVSSKKKSQEVAITKEEKQDATNE